MGKAKEKAAVKLPKADEVASAKPLLEKLAKRKAKLAKVREAIAKDGAVDKFDPKHRVAKKRVKRAQRKLREALKYAVARAKPAAPAAADAPAPAAAPAS
jgi:hypothetical protein